MATLGLAQTYSFVSTSGITETARILDLFSYVNTSGSTVTITYTASGLTYQKIIGDPDNGPSWSAPYTPIQNVPFTHYAGKRGQAVPNNHRHVAQVHYIQESGFELWLRLQNGTETLIDRGRAWDKDAVIYYATLPL